VTQIVGRVVVVSGNPQPGSRTGRAAELVGAKVGALIGESIDATETLPLVELGGVGPGLLGWGDPAVSELKATVLSAQVLVIASPTFKAGVSGLLKLFLDQFDHDELAGVTTVAMMTGGGPAHSLAVESQLKPVLVEIGASLPTRGLYISGPEVDDPEPAIDKWLIVAGPILARSVGPR
jgi:FMN reductase